MIKNLTHNLDGSIRLRRSITTKLAIGLPPDAGGNYPKKLDHFVFQKKGSAQVNYNDDRGNKRTRSEVVWQIDETLQKHYGDTCKGVWIILLDDDADVAFRTELAWWSKTQRNCHGDGEVGHLKSQGPKPGPDIQRPCANHGCPEWADGTCKPSGDLYFLLADFPSLGTICKLHTTSFQSLTEIRTALEDLRSVTGGRLMGIRVKLTVRIEKNVFRDKKKNGALTTSTKHVLGLELAATDIKALTASLTDNMRVFESVKLQLGVRSVDVVEDPDTEVAPLLAAEFYGESAPEPEGEIISPSKAAQPGSQEITDDDLPAAMFQPVDMTPWSKADALEFYKAWSKSGHTEEAVRTYMRDQCGGVESSFQIPVAYRNTAFKWARSRPAEAPLPPQSDEELECRSVMGMLGLNFVEQSELIDMHRGDWAAIKAELRFLADKREAGQ